MSGPLHTESLPPWAEYIRKTDRLLVKQLGSPITARERVHEYRKLELEADRDGRLTRSQQSAVAVQLASTALTVVLDRPDWSLRETQSTFAWLTERAGRVRVTSGVLYCPHLDTVFNVSLLYAHECVRNNHMTEARAVVAYVRRRFGRLRRLRRCSGLARFCAIAKLAHLRIEAAAADPSLRAHGLRVLGTSRRKR